MSGSIGWRVRAAVVLAALTLVLGPGCAGGAGEARSTGCRGSSDAPEPDPVPLSRYVGTWRGTWAGFDAPAPGSEAPHGEMTLTVDAAGGLSGQVTDAAAAAAGQIGTVSGTITAGGSSGIADITTTFGDQSARHSGQIVIVQTDGHLRGSMHLPTTASLAGFDLARQ